MAIPVLDSKFAEPVRVETNRGTWVFPNGEFEFYTLNSVWTRTNVFGVERCENMSPLVVRSPCWEDGVNSIDELRLRVIENRTVPETRIHSQ